ncbi:MAG TPA: hypothetical protein VM940_00550 [Chthoniobacterales bacterium]|jgi:hypothetical protein|nr:hypothetical protein [Chthoniobacterales bacterium]
MKLLLFGLFMTCAAAVSVAGDAIGYPKDEPAFTVSFPEGREPAKIAGKENKLIWWSKEGYNVVISPSKATSSDDMKAAATAAVTAHATGMGSKDIKASEPTEKDEKIFVTAECQQEWDGKLQPYSATAVVFEAGGSYFQLVSLSKADASKKREADITSIVASIKAAKDSDDE